MNVLFWAGYQKNRFDGNTKTGLGGTEIAIIKVAESLTSFGFKVVVSGEVEDSGIINGVEWIHSSKIHDKYFNMFDAIIGASYIHIVPEFKGYDRAKKIYWAHNTSPFPWWKGEALPQENIKDYLTEDLNYLDAVVCLTDWHADQWSRDFYWKNPIIIGNGISTETFAGRPPKNQDSFIWSSAIDRGLIDLLKNWPKIKEGLEYASLNVYWPAYSSEYSQMEWIEENKERLEKLDVSFKGPVTQEELHNAMLKSEYWCYLSDYEETYCITALEMQYSGVIPIVNPTAALQETAACGITLDNNETKWDNLIQLLNGLSRSEKRKLKLNSINWAKKQTWFARSYDWKNLLESL